MKMINGLQRGPDIHPHILRLHDWLRELPDGTKALADRGFWGKTFPDNLEMLVPHAPAKGQFDMTFAQVVNSRGTCTQWRGVVERANARMKRFRVCQGVTPGSVTLENIGLKWRVAAILSNLYFVPLTK
jgi:hypothetical protein